MITFCWVFGTISAVTRVSSNAIAKMIQVACCDG